MPLAIYTGFYYGLGVEGIWIAVAVGNLIIFLMMGITLATLDWGEQINFVRDTMKNESINLLQNPQDGLELTS